MIHHIKTIPKHSALKICFTMVIGLSTQCICTHADSPPTNLDATNAVAIEQLDKQLQAIEIRTSAQRDQEKIVYFQLQQQIAQNGWINPNTFDHLSQSTFPSDKAVILNISKRCLRRTDYTRLSEAKLKQLRDIFRRMKALDQGHLSGAVWLYDSELSAFADPHLEAIDTQFIQKSFESATSLRKKHQYADAQKIYKNLLADYANTEHSDSIKVLLTATVVEDYNYQAKIAFAKHNYKKGRAALTTLASLYPNSEIATKALADLKKMVSHAVTVNKKAGDSHYKAKTQYGVPQKEAAIFYQHTYEADPEGPQAPYALYWWSRALVTEGKYDLAIQKLELLLRQFPQSDMLAQATYSLGFDYMINKEYPKAKTLFQKVVEEYGDTDRAPEALWQMSIQDATRNNFPGALKAMQMLHDRYPKSSRWPQSAKWVGVFKEKIRTKGTW